MIGLTLAKVCEIMQNLMGEFGSNYSSVECNDAAQCAIYEVEAYCNRKFDNPDDTMCYVFARIAVLRLTRRGLEGVASQSFSGVSESFIDGYPADIKAILNAKRRVKVV